MAVSRNKNIKHTKNGIEAVKLDFSILEQLAEDNCDIKISDDCYTVRELSKITNRPVKKIREMISKCIENETCEFIGRKEIKSIDGKASKIPVYKFKKKQLVK